MKARVITVIEYLFIGVLLIAMSAINLLALICFSLAAVVRFIIRAAGTAREMIRETIRTVREMWFCYRIPATEYLEYFKAECRDAWDFRNEIIAADKA